MTTEQFLTLVGVIWIAPHVPRLLALVYGCLILIAAAALKGLGWLP